MNIPQIVCISVLNSAPNLLRFPEFQGLPVLFFFLGKGRPLKIHQDIPTIPQCQIRAKSTEKKTHKRFLESRQSNKVKFKDFTSSPPGHPGLSCHEPFPSRSATTLQHKMPQELVLVTSSPVRQSRRAEREGS